MLSPESLLAIGIVTGIGVLIASSSYYYYSKYVSTPPSVDSLDFHEQQLDILRLEIFSLIIKLNISEPKQQNFNNLSNYFYKLAPIDDLSKRLGDASSVPFYDKYFNHPDSPINNLYKVLYKLQRKDLLHLISDKVINHYLKLGDIETVSQFIVMNFSEKKVSSFLGQLNDTWDFICGTQCGLSDTQMGLNVDLMTRSMWTH